MRVSIQIPLPAAMKVGREAYIPIKAGTELHRIHPSAYKSAEFNGTDKGNARFSPIRDASGSIIPTIYTGQSFACAVCEIVLRCPDMPPPMPGTIAPLAIVHPLDYHRHQHSHVRTTHDLNLVSLTATGQRKIGVSGNALLAGPMSSYAITRGWAEHIHATCPTAQGLYYTSYQYGPEFALILFGDRVPVDILEPLSQRAVADPACHGEIESIAKSLWIDYVDV